MSSPIKQYDSYTEIKNGLFVSIPDEEFTFLGEENQGIFHRLRTIVGHDPALDIAGDGGSRGITLFTGVEGMRQFNEAVQLELYGQTGIPTHRDLPDSITTVREFRTEQEAIEYFDRISQEDE